jgi:hypothetical protein
LSTFAKKLFLMITNGFIYSVKDSKGMGVLEYLTDFVTSTNPKDCNPKLVVKVFNELVKMDRQSQNPTFKNFVKELRARFGNSMRSNMINWNGKQNVKIDNVINPAPTAPAKLDNNKSKLNAMMPAAQQVGNAAAVAAANAGAPPAAVEAAQAVAEASAANGDPAAQVAEQTEQAVTENGGSKQAAIQAGNAAGAVQAANAPAPSLNQVSNNIGAAANKSKLNAFLAERSRKHRRFRYRSTRSL